MSKMMIRRALRVAFVFAACLSIASPAYAYLDPGTGSMLVSAVIGLFAAVALALKMFWYRVVGLFRGKGRDIQPGEVKGPPATGE
jgi:hypothetical protein